VDLCLVTFKAILTRPRKFGYWVVVRSLYSVSLPDNKLSMRRAEEQH